MWFKVQAKQSKSGEIKTLEINVHNEREALDYGRIWFPVDHYRDHQIARKEEPNERERAA